MKRFISILFAFIIAFIPFTDNVFDINVSAAKIDKSSSTTKIESALIKGFTDFDEKIEWIEKDIFYNQNEFNTYYDSYFELFCSIYRKFMTDKNYFYVEDNCELTGSPQKDGTHFSIPVKYVTTKDKYKEYKKRFSKSLKKITSGVNNDWTDIQKAAYLHDQLVLNTTYLIQDSSRYTSTPYSALVEGKALCVGFTRTYAILLNEQNIKNKYVSGTASNSTGKSGHAWNLVKIGKHWYHVDCTFDDSKDDNVYHEYFLKSDKALKKHSDYSPVGLAKSSKYDTMMWNSSYSPFHFYGNGIIYRVSDSLYVYNTQKNKITKLLSVKDTWELRYTKYYDTYVHTRGYTLWGNYSHSAQYNDDIYYNLAHGVYKYNLKTGKVTTIYSNKKSDSLIIAIYIKNKKLYGTFMDADQKIKNYLIAKLA